MVCPLLDLHFYNVITTGKIPATGGRDLREGKSGGLRSGIRYYIPARYSWFYRVGVSTAGQPKRSASRLIM